jgi:formate hydrogenlyase subunit 3/multisubunit Na+/H+ antiporter MnhD subunit
MSALLPAVVAFPLICAGLAVMIGRRLLAQRVIAFVGVGFVLVAAVLLLVTSDAEGRWSPRSAGGRLRRASP